MADSGVRLARGAWPVTLAFRLLIGVLLFARLATAQVTFPDNFEGTLLQSQTPAGQWQSITSPDFPSTLAIDAAAAHRGQSGLRITDTTTLPDTGELGSALYRPIAGSNAQHVRFWFRAGTLTSATNQWVNIAMIHAQSTNQAVAELYFDAQDKRLHLQAFGKTSTTPERKSVSFDATVWHLIELSTENMGSNSARASAAIDGQVSVSIAGIDWSGVNYTGLYVGQPYAAGLAFTGTLDFDDYRASAAEPASKLAFSIRPSLLRVGGCVTGLIELRTAKDAAAPAPEAVPITLSAPNFTFGPSCQTLGSPISIAEGGSSAFFAVRADAAGMAQVRMSTPDFIGSEFAANVLENDPGDAGADAGLPQTPDAGSLADSGTTPPEPIPNDAGTAAESGVRTELTSASSYRVACGCDSSAFSCFGGLALVWLFIRRRT